MGSSLAPGHSQHDHRPLPAVRTGGKCCQVQFHEVPSRSNLVWDAGRGNSPKINGQGGYIQIATQTSNPMSVLQRVTHNGINYGSLTAHAWDGAGD